MAERNLYSPDSDPMPTGIEFLGQYHDRLKMLFDTAVLPLTAIGGTANAVTATLDPPLTAGLVAGMKFGVTWAATNTGGVTLALNGGTAVPVLDAVGAALIAGAITAGQRSLIEYVAGAFRLIGAGSAEARALPYFLKVTSSMTWVKPPGFADDAWVVFRALGAGGGGGGQGGGGGGAFAERWMRYIAVPSSVTFTIGAGGVGSTGSGTAGGNTVIGSILTAFGGGPGGSAGSGFVSGGGGGGELGAGGPAGSGNGGPIGGGHALVGPSTPSTSVGDASTLNGGGAGGSGLLGGGRAARGAGGGSGVNSSVGGVSAEAGNGGASGLAGAIPGGGGGARAAGARGEAYIWIVG